jgi:hypothetical protein
MNELEIALLVVSSLIPFAILMGIVLNRLLTNSQPVPFKNNIKCVILKHIWVERLPHKMFQVITYDCTRCGKGKHSGYGYHDEFWVEE